MSASRASKRATGGKKNGVRSKKGMVVRSRERDEEKPGVAAENRDGKKRGKGMLTHVTRAVACEHPSLVLALIAAHFFILLLLRRRSLSPASSRGVPLPFVHCRRVSCARCTCVLKTKGGATVKEWKSGGWMKRAKLFRSRRSPVRAGKLNYEHRYRLVERAGRRRRATGVVAF